MALDSSGTSGQAYRVYRAAFAREPDSAGVGYWMTKMDQGMSLQEVASGFIGSAEFRTLYGSNPGNASFVTKLYANVLGRAPDQGGYDWWLQQMNSNGMSQASVLSGFSESAENQAAVAQLIGNGFSYTEWLG